MSTPGRAEITTWFKELQDDICHGLVQLDGLGEFHEDQWERPGGGGGRTRVMEEGDVIAKGGVNFSAVHGETPQGLRDFLGRQDATMFYATGVSIVLHSVNPWVPIIHMNVRYFEVDEHTWWFGGGIDLTPHYIFEEDARDFHQLLKTVCDRHHPSWYADFSKWADEYFYIPHRGETRGVGGIFFDRLGAGAAEKAELFSFVKDVGNAFLKAYSPLAMKYRNKEFSAAELEWQKLRRGRYVEFNLVYDRGTRFGLETSGRIESILMSLPPVAGWKYDNKPEEGSPEAATQELLQKKIRWLAD